ncbi:MAG: ChbG/HpnK family deacetylase [Gemmatimonadaceae bacterium]
MRSDTRAIILHADDVGIAHSVNDAVIAAFERGAIDSCSAMVPCAPFAEFAKWAQSHKAADIGVHLTLTSSPSARFRPVLPAKQAPTLVDNDGNFPVSWPATSPVNMGELEAELRAQIDRALALGIDVTHLDGHQHILQLRGAALFELFDRIAGEYRLPYRVAKSWYMRAPWLEAKAGHDTIPMEKLISPSATDAKPDAWSAWYAERVRAIPPGLTELFMHPGYDTPELRALLPDERPWGSAWRQRDFDMLFSGEIADALKSSGAVRTGWRRVRSALRTAGK